MGAPPELLRRRVVGFMASGDELLGLELCEEDIRPPVESSSPTRWRSGEGLQWRCGSIR